MSLVKLTKENVTVSKAPYQPKAVLILVDEMSEVMNDTNYKLVNSIQNSLGSIARLGRAAGVHLCLATQRPSSNVINADLKNNIQMSCLLGDFDTGASTLLFDKDISGMSKPEIKGRGFLKSGKEIYEFQSYWTEKEKDFQLRGVEVKTDESSKTVKPVDVHSKQKIRPSVEKKEKKAGRVQRNKSSKSAKGLEGKVTQKIDGRQVIAPQEDEDPIIKELRAKASEAEDQQAMSENVQQEQEQTMENKKNGPDGNGFEEIDAEEILRLMKQREDDAVNPSTADSKANEGFSEITIDEIIANMTGKKTTTLRISKKDEAPHALGANGITLKLKKKGGETE